MVRKNSVKRPLQGVLVALTLAPPRRGLVFLASLIGLAYVSCRRFWVIVRSPYTAKRRCSKVSTFTRTWCCAWCIQNTHARQSFSRTLFVLLSRLLARPLSSEVCLDPRIRPNKISGVWRTLKQSIQSTHRTFSEGEPDRGARLPCSDSFVFTSVHSSKIFTKVFVG